MSTGFRGRYGTVKTNRATFGEKAELRSHVNKLLERRKQIVTLNVDLKQIIERHIYDDAEGPFIKRLWASEKWKRAINASDSIALSIPVSEDLARLRYASIQVKFPHELPCPIVNHSDSISITTKDPHYKAINDFCLARIQISEEGEFVNNVIFRLTQWCNTYKQMYRIWPHVVNYIPHDDKKDQLRGIKRASPYPRGVDIADIESLQKELAQVNVLLTQALLLPKGKRVQDIYFHY